MTALDLTTPTLTIEPWTDPVVDSLGHAPRSTYVERFWLPVLGPSTTWLVRLIDARIEAAGGPIELDLTATSAAMGLGRGKGRHSPIVRALHRTRQFGLSRPGFDAALAVRRTIPPLTRSQADRLPVALRAEHRRWCEVERDAGTLDAQRRRARRVAIALADLGEDIPSTEQRLHRFGIHPAVAREAAVWAHRVHADGRLTRAPGSAAPLDSAPPLDTAHPLDLGGDAA
ncbi:MAG: hypothetical protein GXY13_05670 [Acidimicrobiales bacterium]|nr:hypothetical protein [Acidimicrobiales bacterium]